MAKEFDSKKGTGKITITLNNSDGRKIEFQIEGDANPADIAAYAAALGFKSTNEEQNITKITSKNAWSNTGNISDFDLSDFDFTKLSKIERLKLLIRSFTKNDNQWFGAKEILNLYKKYIDENIPHSTISTYLARLYKDNLLDRSGTRRDLEYSLRPEQMEKIPDIDLRQFAELFQKQ